MPRQKRPSAQVGSQVRFEYQGRERTGTIARLGRAQAFIVGDDRRSYQVNRDRLLPPQSSPELDLPELDLPELDLPELDLPELDLPELKLPETVPPAEPLARTLVLSPSTLHPGDRVIFSCRDRLLVGRIARLNARRAHVVCDNDEEYAVPYPLLTLESPARNRTPLRTPKELADVVRLAEGLLTHHRLDNWRFEFDHAARRAGSCQYRRRRITLSLQFTRHAPEEEIRDTLLHEIAHALVGNRHNHDAVWQAKAREIGASGARCHDRRFTPPRYIVQCRNGCWTATAERRRRHVICSKCRGEIVYQTYTADRWQQLQPPAQS
jgi:predicted SprT family Zn-dependent metalloprotease